MTKHASNIPEFPVVQFESHRILPFHIVQSIFGYIKQVDALECLLVCRGWYASVPQYTTSIWETVNFAKLKVNSTRLALCLGPHVRRVILSDDVESILSTLIDRNCCHIDSIMFNKSATLPKPQQLLGLLSRICAPTLHFNKLKHEIPIIDIITAYPQLTKFSCVYNKSVRIAMQPYEEEHRVCAAKTNISTLCLDVRLRPLMRLLSRCPSLQSLHLWIQWPGILDHNFDMIDFYHLFRMCPRLEQLKCYWPDKDDLPYRWQLTTNESTASNHCQLTTFFSSITLGHGPDEIIPIIRQHQQTLQALHIDNCDLGDTTDITWNQLERVQATQLQQLFTRSLPWQNGALSSFLSQCPLLCDLTLHDVDGKVLKNQQVLGAFSMLKNLRNFELTMNQKRRRRSTTDTLSNIVEAIAFATPSLQRLSVSGFEVLKDNLLFAASLNKNLRILRLGMGDPIKRNTRPTTKDGIKKFVDELGPRIQQLELTNLKLGSKSFLSELAERKELKKMVLVCCGRVSDAGLKAFLETKADSLHYVRLESCHVERHNALITYCRDKLHYSTMVNKNRFHISRP